MTYKPDRPDVPCVSHYVKVNMRLNSIKFKIQLGKVSFSNTTDFTAASHGLCYMISGKTGPFEKFEV